MISGKFYYEFKRQNRESQEGSSGENSRISPGWQSSSLHMAFRVEKRIARTFPVFRLERLTLEMPTRSASSFREIFRSAITRSSLKIIFRFSSKWCVFLQGSVQDPFYKKKNDHNRKKGQDTFKNTINQIAIQRICNLA